MTTAVTELKWAANRRTAIVYAPGPDGRLERVASLPGPQALMLAARIDSEHRKLTRGMRRRAAIRGLDL